MMYTFLIPLLFEYKGHNTFISLCALFIQHNIRIIVDRISDIDTVIATSQAKAYLILNSLDQ
jgi:hypothetical protein